MAKKKDKLPNEDSGMITSAPPVRDDDVRQLESMVSAPDNAPLSMPSKFDVADMTKKVRKLCEVCSGITFHPYQVEYAEGMIETILRNDGEEITALFSRQSGSK